VKILLNILLVDKVDKSLTDLPRKSTTRMKTIPNPRAARTAVLQVIWRHGAAFTPNQGQHLAKAKG